MVLGSYWRDMELLTGSRMEAVGCFETQAGYKALLLHLLCGFAIMHSRKMNLLHFHIIYLPPIDYINQYYHYCLAMGWDPHCCSPTISVPTRSFEQFRNGHYDLLGSVDARSKHLGVRASPI